MLNRRNLRIKVMQSLFALHQCREANYKLGLDMISKTFAPDLNSMEVQDKPLLSEKKSTSKKLFDNGYD
jgi:N utilization substance protein B